MARPEAVEKTREKATAGGRSLLFTVAMWVAPALIALVAGTAFVTGSTATSLADSAYDRSIAGALRAIDLNISTESGGIGVELPYPLFEAFEATASGAVYFRVATEDGLVEIGDSFLPRPRDFSGDGFYFYNDEFLGAPIRMGIFKRRLTQPLYGAAKPQTIILQVAESMQSRNAFRFELIKSAAALNLVCVFAVVVLLLAGLSRALSPLSALRTGFERRDPNDLSPVDASALPREIRPLVDTFNRLLGRHTAQAEAQRHLLDDASHQLRTPIAVLRTQIDYALHTSAAEERVSVLQAMRRIVERASRTTTHFLTMARIRNFASDIAPDTHMPIDIKALLTELARMRLSDARRQRVDLNLDLPERTVYANGSETLIFEALSNLLDNAIHHSPKQGNITLQVEPLDNFLRITLIDQGPGMSQELIDKIGQRHLDQTSNRDGAGLGLAVVVEIAQAHEGTLTLQNRTSGGLKATLTLPSPPATSKSRALTAS
ncbi:sensor histidine kinase [Rhizobium metallidurans]|uniref:histidine kinase n=1 Tax=Rhizobium metallidurans TaxID=1265931 RepID=A0A7W6CY60_9HYPH|nr:sensor histidine kinase [Rhizobium metallidurans]MBB3967012.1 two-component system sensor histidine kinase TctE [Rhizobium metallidurans]